MVNVIYPIAMNKNIIGKIQLRLSRSGLIVRKLIKVRNQINAIIGVHITRSIDHQVNGEELLLKLILPSCERIIDVGGNVGNYTKLVLSHIKHTNYQIHLFEPSPFCYEVLMKNFKNTERVQLYNMALSSKQGQLLFHMPDETSEISSFHLSNPMKTIDVEVETSTVDQIFKDQPIDFLKIDTEGHDFYVLNGCVKHLELQQIKFIQFEYNRTWKNSGTTLTYAIDFLKQYNYVTYLIQPDGLFRFNVDYWDEYFRYSNFFSAHHSQFQTISPLVKGDF